MYTNFTVLVGRGDTVEMFRDDAPVGEWPNNIRITANGQGVTGPMMLSLSDDHALGLFRQLRDRLVEAKLVDTVELVPSDEARKRELREIADRLLGLSGADDDLVTLAEANAEPGQLARDYGILGGVNAGVAPEDQV